VRVLWLNGCFGSGKSATAAALVAADPHRLLFDPELVGYLLWEIDPSLRAKDFRELRVWRRLVVDSAVTLLAEFERPLVVPMSLFSEDHLSVIDDLRGRGVTVDHVVLSVDEPEVRRRILAQRKSDDDETDAGTRAFRLAQLPAGLAMALDPPADARVLVTAGLPIVQAAALLL
jgi:hypothetical protein